MVPLVDCSTYLAPCAVARSVAHRVIDTSVPPPRPPSRLRRRNRADMRVADPTLSVEKPPDLREIGGASREFERNRDDKRRATAGDARDLHPSAEGFDAVMESDEP